MARNIQQRKKIVFFHFLHLHNNLLYSTQFQLWFLISFSLYLLCTNIFSISNWPSKRFSGDSCWIWCWEPCEHILSRLICDSQCSGFVLFNLKFLALHRMTAHEQVNFAWGVNLSFTQLQTPENYHNKVIPTSFVWLVSQVLNDIVQFCIYFIFLSSRDALLTSIDDEERVSWLSTLPDEWNHLMVDFTV